METEVMVAVPPPSMSMDFNFDSNCSSPYITAPSTPQRFGNFFSTTPTTSSSNFSSLQPSEPTNNNIDDDTHEDFDFDFEFNFSGQPPRPSLSADELFHGGKILPLKLIQEAASNHQQQHKIQKQRSSSFSIPSTESKTRSDDVFSHENIKTSTSSSFSSFLSSISFSKGYRKWSFKDLLLFRSASEGRATNRKKYTVLCKTTAYDDVNNSSFRSTENSGSVSKRRGPVSAHELHYTLNRAASEELRRKTMLPYKQGLLGCLGFNHGMTVHQISRRFGSLERS